MMEAENVKIVLVDDHPLILEGLKSTLEDQEQIEVSATATNMRECISAIQAHSPKVLILDLNMPGKNGLPMVEEIKTSFPALKVVVLTMYFDVKLIKELEGLGVEGFLLKNSSKEELITAINEVAEGRFFKQKSLRKINQENHFELSVGNEVRDEFSKRHALGKRELEILILVALGKSSDQISEVCFISPETVKTHRKNILKKLDMDNSAQLGAFAVRNQLI